MQKVSFLKKYWFSFISFHQGISQSLCSESNCLFCLYYFWYIFNVLHLNLCSSLYCTCNHLNLFSISIFSFQLKWIHSKTIQCLWTKEHTSGDLIWDIFGLLHKGPGRTVAFSDLTDILPLNFKWSPADFNQLMPFYAPSVSKWVGKLLVVLNN